MSPKDFPHLSLGSCVVWLFGHFWQEFLPLLLVSVSKPKWREINSCQNGGKNFGKQMREASLEKW
jgi:hypothetical protein